MNDEIKEILDYFRKYMTIEDCIRLSKIEDYITNLQEENKYLDNEVNNMTDYVKELQQKIDKAIEYINKNYGNLLLSNPPKEAFNKDNLLNLLQGKNKE